MLKRAGSNSSGKKTPAPSWNRTISDYLGYLIIQFDTSLSSTKLFYGILREQFEKLRDGDRLWYERSLTYRELRMIRRTRLSDIIIRNTDIREGQIPDNVFYVSDRRRR